MIISRNRRDAKRIQSVASKCMINKRKMEDAFFRAFSVHARRSVRVFSRGMREGEFNNAAGKWRRVFRDSRLWKEFRTYNKRHNANTSRQKGWLERAEAATLLRESILMRKNWSANIQSNNVIILRAKRNSLDIFRRELAASTISTEPWKRSNLSSLDFQFEMANFLNLSRFKVWTSSTVKQFVK